MKLIQSELMNYVPVNQDVNFTKNLWSLEDECHISWNRKKFNMQDRS